MFFIDASTGMATLKTGGASAVVPVVQVGGGTQGTTKLMLPHEMLTANGTAQNLSNVGSSGHSTTLLLSSNNFFNPSSSFHFVTSTNSNSNSSNFSHNSNNSNSHDHRTSFIGGIHYNHQNNSSTSTTVAAHNNLLGTNYLSSNHTSHPLAAASTTTSSATTTIQQSSSNTCPTTSNNSHNNMNNKLLSTTTTTTTTNTTATTLNSAVNAEQIEDEVIEQQQATIHENDKEITETENAEDGPEIDIVINNVVCSFSVRCHLNLRTIALNGYNVEFRRENGMVTMKLRKPYTTASIWSSGKITCTGATSEDTAKVAARRYARMLQKLGFRVKFNNFRVVNVLGTCSMPWAIKITQFSEKHRKEASYEPELHPGVTYKMKELKATLKIFSTGSITVTAASVSLVQQAIVHIYPLVYEFRKKRTPEEEKKVKAHLHDPNTFDPNDLIEVDEDFDEGEQMASVSAAKPPPPKKRRRRPAGKAINDPDEDIMQISDVEEDPDDSDDDL